MRSYILFLFALNSISLFAQPRFPANVLQRPQKYSNEIESAFKVIKVHEFIPSDSDNKILLENGYASALIKNPEKLVKDEKIADTVKIIFTNYPADKNFWLTDYHILLSQRLKELFKLNEALNDESINYLIVLQTNCKTDNEARNMFHGIEISYHPQIEEGIKLNPTDSVVEIKTEGTTDPVVNIEAKRISNFIYSNGGLSDSTVLKVLERNKHWKKALVVIDWTGSMYPYGGQAVLWHSLNLKTSGLKYFVFFNDGNNEVRKKIGRTGGIYFEKAENIKKLVNLLNKVKIKGNGGDAEENNLEAIIKGMQKFPGFEEIILIADNNSCIRDFCLLNEINVPVKVVLCGTYSGINPQFLNLAYKTNGSIHTIEEDIDDLRSRKNSNADWTIDGTEYRYNLKRDLFELVIMPDKDDPHYCEPFYKKRKCKCEKLKQ